MLLPMGLPEDVVVIAWGLSLERYVAIKDCGALPLPLLLPRAPCLLLGLGFRSLSNSSNCCRLGSHRPTMIKYKYSNIRDLMGPKVDLEMSRANPICRI